RLRCPGKNRRSAGRVTCDVKRQGENVGENLVLPDVDRRAVRGLKFSAALPERLAVATVAARLADCESARSVLGESARFQYDG
ncbi:hypothetical protein, partial [Streptomyces tailanensis]|uniref:hypothetical protein n=1 Tax=Streptomyces tailanensis TaxID=2569858 RepID=UPI001FE7784C